MMIMMAGVDGSMDFLKLALLFAFLFGGLATALMAILAGRLGKIPAPPDQWPQVGEVVCLAAIANRPTPLYEVVEVAGHEVRLKSLPHPGRLEAWPAKYLLIMARPFNGTRWANGRTIHYRDGWPVTEELKS